ncbi:MAG: hypothetical protein ACO2O2_11395 [Acidilobaceae archaeon]
MDTYRLKSVAIVEKGASKLPKDEEILVLTVHRVSICVNLAS